jgi:uncharacterized protein YjbI with pentapeptide repeats
MTLSLRTALAAAVLGTAALGVAPASGGPTGASPVSLGFFASGDCPSCDLSRQNLLKLTLKPGSNFDRARFVSTRIKEIQADGVRLKSADFSYAIVPNARFIGAVLEDASFRQVNAPNAVFTAAMVDRADFTGAKLQGADLEDAIGLTQDQLNVACGDAQTRLPEGMTIPRC